MTTSEYLRKSLSKFDISTDDIDLIIVENELIEEASVNVRQAKLAICKSLSVWLPVLSSVSEGGVSKAWNVEGLKFYYSTLCLELGIVDPTQPKIRDRSNSW